MWLEGWLGRENVMVKLFSLLIAVLDGYVIYLFHHYEKAHRFGTMLPVEDWEIFVTDVLMAIGIIGFGLKFIWFGESISESLEQPSERLPYGDWAPTWLIKFIGWIILIIPAVIFLGLKLNVNLSQ